MKLIYPRILVSQLVNFSLYFLVSWSLEDLFDLLGSWQLGVFFFLLVSWSLGGLFDSISMLMWILWLSWFKCTAHELRGVQKELLQNIIFSEAKHHSFITFLKWNKCFWIELISFISPQSERSERRGLSIFLPIVSEWVSKWLLWWVSKGLLWSYIIIVSGMGDDVPILGALVTLLNAMAYCCF